MIFLVICFPKRIIIIIFLNDIRDIKSLHVYKHSTPLSTSKDAVNFGEAFFGVFDDFHGHLLIALPAHHLMVKDVLILVLDDADPESKFHRHSHPALADPLSVGLKDGEDFFIMRDGFVEVQPADDLAHELRCIFVCYSLYYSR